MGDRYYLLVVCPECGTKEDDVYYAPTCGIDEWECSNCGHILNLEEYSGISYDDCSNRKEIESICKNFKTTRKGR